MTFPKHTFWKSNNNNENHEPVEDDDEEDDDEEDLPEDPVKRRKKLHEMFYALFLMTQETIQSQVKRYVSGELTIDEWRDKFLDALHEAHAQAAEMGRLLAGLDGQLSESDRILAVAIMETQAEFLANFIAAIEEGWDKNADGNVSEGRIQARAKLYARRLLGTANEAWARTIATDATLFYWYLGETEDHCQDCPDRQIHSPYRLDELPGFPGDGSTQCLVNCKCYLRTGNGESSFKWDEMDLSGSATGN